MAIITYQSYNQHRFQSIYNQGYNQPSYNSRNQGYNQSSYNTRNQGYSYDSGYQSNNNQGGNTGYSNQASQSNSNRQGASQKTCYNCGGSNHIAKFCLSQSQNF